jgi:flagellar basal-body rod protein FlgF
MFRGVYTATSGMIASGRKQEMLTNNLANAETPGYKQDQTVLRSFPDILMQRMRDEQGLHVQGKPSFPGKTPLGVLHTGVYAQEGIPSFKQGDLRETGRFIDFALIDQSLPVNPETNQRGNLFFAVQKTEGEIHYTRNGQFAVDPQGFLTTSEGYYVLNQELDRIAVGTQGFNVLEDGRILQTLEDGTTVADGRLWLGYTEQAQRMSKEGNGLFQFVGQDGQPQDVTTVNFLNDPDNPTYYPYQVRQGFIESSNVDVTHTMTEMMSTFRLYEANQKVLQAYDRSIEKTVNEVGRVF